MYSLFIHRPKKGNGMQCKNFKVLNLISRPRSCLKWGRAGRRGLKKQIFDNPVLVVQHLQHGRICTKTSFISRRLLYEALWNVLRIFKLVKGIVRTTDALYDVSRSSVQFSMLVGKVFSTMMAVYQSCTLSPVLFDIYKKKGHTSRPSHFCVYRVEAVQ